ncbi:hypothetical protein [Thermomonospora umbrina]|uniref:Lipoprotein n=1 Tax=Thermomonospora umbrina TaxID=111806 RepID=A0A3D9SPE6_9ACTN|nr:hypothetical protein [Thermomonospora umbrina]REE96320.1 hypothetical protein DFJ69_1750 [Thermomonospora umbrina]
MRRCAFLLCVALVASGCSVTRTISAGAYRVAVTDGTIAELGSLGLTLHERPACHMPRTESPTVVRITCTGRTDTGRAVRVEGLVTAADTSRPDERYVITVDGAEVLRKPCLGRGCAGRRPVFDRHPHRYGDPQIHGKAGRHQG